jgi:hypothetical protein
MRTPLLLICAAVMVISASPLYAADSNAPAVRAQAQKGQIRPETPKRGDIRERMEQRHEEYMKWLEKNYPEEAIKLSQARSKNPELYFQQLSASIEQNGKLFRADKDNPAMAKLIRDDIELKAQINKTLEQLKTATDENKKKAIKDELQTLVAKRFDLILAQKQLRYQDLNKRLENLKEEIKKQESELDKLKDKKDAEVKKRIEELLNPTAELKWD